MSYYSILWAMWFHFSKKYFSEFFKRFTWPHISFIHEINLVNLFSQSAFIKTTHISAHVCSLAVQHPDGRLLSDLTVVSSVELFLLLPFGLYYMMVEWGTCRQLLPGPPLRCETEVLCALFLCHSPSFANSVHLWYRLWGTSSLRFIFCARKWRLQLESWVLQRAAWSKPQPQWINHRDRMQPWFT